MGSEVSKETAAAASAPEDVVGLSDIEGARAMPCEYPDELNRKLRTIYKNSSSRDVYRFESTGPKEMACNRSVYFSDNSRILHRCPKLTVIQARRFTGKFRYAFSIYEQAPLPSYLSHDYDTSNPDQIWEFSEDPKITTWTINGEHVPNTVLRLCEGTPLKKGNIVVDTNLKEKDKTNILVALDSLRKQDDKFAKYLRMKLAHDVLESIIRIKNTLNMYASSFTAEHILQKENVLVDGFDVLPRMSYKVVEAEGIERVMTTIEVFESVAKFLNVFVNPGLLPVSATQAAEKVKNPDVEVFVWSTFKELKKVYARKARKASRKIMEDDSITIPRYGIQRNIGPEYRGVCILASINNALGRPVFSLREYMKISLDPEDPRQSLLYHVEDALKLKRAFKIVKSTSPDTMGDIFDFIKPGRKYVAAFIDDKLNADWGHAVAILYPDTPGSTPLLYNNWETQPHPFIFTRKTYGMLMTMLGLSHPAEIFEIDEITRP